MKTMEGLYEQTFKTGSCSDCRTAVRNYDKARVCVISKPQKGEPAITVSDVNQTFEQGSKAAANNISVVSLHGTWHEMGRQYGSLLKEEVTFSAIELPSMEKYLRA